jgi:hypothetical protein
MADKQITVAVPEDRVPEFYVWFAGFLASEPGAPPWGGARGRGMRGHMGGPRHRFGDAAPWSAADAEQAAWLYGKLAPPARALFDRLGGGALDLRLEGHAEIVVGAEQLRAPTADHGFGRR